MMKRIIPIVLILLFSQTVSAVTEVQVYFPNDLSKKESVKSFEIGSSIYISTKDFVRILSAGIFENIERSKIVIYFSGHKIKISANCSFILIDDKVYQMGSHALFDGNDIYLPMRTFLSLFHRYAAPGVLYDNNKKMIIVELLTYNITGLTIEEKANGTIIRVKTTRLFDGGSFTAWSAKNRWFYLTIAGGIADSSTIRQTRLHGIVRAVQIDQVGKTTQLAFRLRGEVENHELYQNSSPNEIVLSLRTPLSFSAEKIKKIRDSWYIDTIIIDAGHGGKDGGTVGKYGLKEKFVALDISKRVGRLLEKYTNVKVIYTRDEDVFIPLWKRTKMANEKVGKLFVSIHGNANKNRRIRGFETYILSPGKTADAAAVAERENAVIKLEEETSRYEKLTEDKFIIASLVQNSFMKESEDLAAMIQHELRKSIPSPDRGVKQAGFYVLIGASMPNVLVEVGYLSNPQEEKQLRKPGYRQSIAQSIYQGIRKFKDKYERVLDEESKG